MIIKKTVFFQKGLGFLIIRNLIMAAVAGLLIGLLTEAVWPAKKADNKDVVWGIVGAVLTSVLLALLKGGVRLIPTLIMQVIGALILISLARLLSKEN